MYVLNILVLNDIYKSSRKVWTTHYIPSNLTSLSCNYNLLNSKTQHVYDIVIDLCIYYRQNFH